MCPCPARGRRDPSSVTGLTRSGPGSFPGVTGAVSWFVCARPSPVEDSPETDQRGRPYGSGDARASAHPKPAEAWLSTTTPPGLRTGPRHNRHTPGYRAWTRTNCGNVRRPRLPSWARYRPICLNARRGRWNAAALSGCRPDWRTRRSSNVRRPSHLRTVVSTDQAIAAGPNASISQKPHE